MKTFGNNRRKFSDLIEPPTEAPFIEVSKPDAQECPAPKPHRKSGGLPAFFKVVVTGCLLIKQPLFLDLGERHQLVCSS
ncbi:hypothetical protein [Vibrio jasicida]|uniref:hypothetical protein n=1 Tax=Vibrio jasicida TaxID=766224 RepID=UPI00391AAF21